MRLFLLSTICLLVSANTNTSDRRPWEEDLEKVAKYLEEQFNVTIGYEVIRIFKVVEDKCPTIGEKLEYTFDELEKCMRGIGVGSETMCSAIKNHWTKCSEPGVDAIASCLPEDRDFPIMVGKIIGGVIEQVCDSTFIEVIEFLTSCINAVSSGSNTECTETMKTIYEPERNKLPTKKTICLLIIEMGKFEHARKLLSSNQIVKMQAQVD